MCGIAGIIANNESTVHSAIAAMNEAQRHRGPNDSGETCRRLPTGFVGLGHRRLSIIDLSNCGHQPMIHPVTGDQLVFNGEIYNFRELRRELEARGEQFQGSGDSEVLLHALSRWGVTCLSRLQGMYAFGFYHAKSQQMLLVRDPLGIKPLYYTESADVFAFASEVRALMSTGLVPADLDMQGVASLLAYGAVQQPNTIFRGVKSFPPGCYRVIDCNGHRNSSAEPFWVYPCTQSGISEGDAIAAVRTTLDDAVRDHLVSDVPLGVFLSSGLDSTVIAGLAARHTQKLRSFTIGFADQPDMSELGLAKQTADLFGLDHTEIQVQGNDAEAHCIRWLNSLDQPSVDGLNIYIISKVVRDQGITVALSGQGGDELFGGYPSFSDVPRLLSYMRLITPLPRSMRRALFSAAGRGRAEAVQNKLADIGQTDGSILELYLQRRRAMSNTQLAAMGIEHGQLGLPSSFMPEGAISGVNVLANQPAFTLSQLESRVYQGNMLLRDSDTNGMAHCLEIRVPLLDQRMLDLMYTLPDEVRRPPGRKDKHLLRTAFASLLRPALLQQKKRGFTLPISRWMVSSLRDLCESAVTSLKSTGILREEGIDALWQSFLKNPDSPIWTRAFTLCVLGSYLKRIKAR